MDNSIAHTLAQAQRNLNTHSLSSQTVKGGQSIEDIQKVAKEFEAVFLSESIRLLFEDIEVDPLLGGGTAEGMYRDMLLNEYGQRLTDSGGIGIADHITSQLLSLQEVR